MTLARACATILKMSVHRGLVALTMLTIAPIGCGVSIVGSICEGCAVFTISDSSPDAGTSSPPPPLRLHADAAADGDVPRAPDASAPSLCAADTGTCVIECADLRCAGGAWCPSDRPCVVRCATSHDCPSISCAADQPCGIDCASAEACPLLDLRALTASSLCVRCGDVCEVPLNPADNVIGCRTDASSCTAPTFRCAF